VASTLLGLAKAEAKLISEYDKMSYADQGRYADHLLNQTVSYLRLQGQHQDAKKVTDHFNNNRQRAIDKFLDNLDIARDLARETGKPIEVEHALILTLREIVRCLLDGGAYEHRRASGLFSRCELKSRAVQAWVRA
jgi:hypothetical protein